MKRTLASIARGLGVLIALGLLGLTVRTALTELRVDRVTWEMAPAALATLLLAGVFLATVLLWRSILTAMDRAVPYGAAVQLWSFSNLGRYVPGKVWQVVGAMVLAPEFGLRPAAAAAAAFLAVGLQVATGALVALPALPALAEGRTLVGIGLVAVAATALVPLCYPGSIPALARRLPRFVGLGEMAAPGRGTVFVWIVALVAIWIAQGLSLALFASAFGEVPIAAVPSYVASWALAYVAGLLALVVPGGLGVREGLLGHLLTAAPAGASPHVVAVASRLWSVAAELVVLALALGLRARGAPRAGTPDRL